MKLQHFKTEEVEGYHFWCPGCQEIHSFHTVGRVIWKFNEDFEAPTFHPSLRIFQEDGFNVKCHLTIRNGKIHFFEDTVHELKGQTVELPDWSTAHSPEKTPAINETEVEVEVVEDDPNIPIESVEEDNRSFDPNLKEQYPQDIVDDVVEKDPNE